MNNEENVGKENKRLGKNDDDDDDEATHSNGGENKFHFSPTAFPYVLVCVCVYVTKLVIEVEFIVL